MKSIQPLFCTFILLLSLFSTTLMSQENDASPKNGIPQNSNNYSSVLWKVSGQGLSKPSYLFGTWHLLCRNEIIFKNKVKVAVSETKQLLMQNFITYLTESDYYERLSEHNKINRGTPIYKIDNRKKRKQLLKLISKELDLKYNRAKRVMPIVKRMTPLEVFLSSLHSYISGCDGLGSFEAMLYDHYEKNAAPIGSFNDRKSFLESLVASGFVQVESLIAYLVDIESQRAVVSEMKSHYYRSEDLLGLKQLYRIFVTNQHTTSEKIDQHIFNIDSDSWISTMIKWMAVESTFITINANYLVGEGGVIKRLRKQGYAVEPVF